MWQDYAVGVVQLVFAIALIPTLLDPSQKPALLTSALNAAGMAVIAAAYLSLQLWMSGIIATLVGLQWCILGAQRYRQTQNPRH